MIKHKSYQSLLALWLILCVMLGYRIYHSDAGIEQPLRITTWDALGYYTYLPAAFIYHDLEKLSFNEPIDQQYHLSGNGKYSVVDLPNGHRPLKYFCGVAMLQMPAFLITHYVIAPYTHYPRDGFSPPYQYALAIGAFLWVLLGLWCLRKFLLLYFDDATVALSLILITLATNFLQYTVIDSGQSHAYIFTLYVLQLWATKKWHDAPSWKHAVSIGIVLGMAIACRPTEAVMIFIPLLWNTQNKVASKYKWHLVKQHKSHLLMASLVTFMMLWPQMIYWKIVTDQWIFDVGSAWRFLTPHWQVLFGFNKGWIIYTPVTLLFLLGLFFMKNQTFLKSVLWFSLLNIWIVIAWADWRYGGSYSTRALMQSYPVWSLALACLLQKLLNTRWHWPLLIISAYLIFVNQIQIGQYNKTVLHYYDMNRKYYQAIYLNPHPQPLDFSLLDQTEQPQNNEIHHPQIISFKNNFKPANDSLAIIDLITIPTQTTWLKVHLIIDSPLQYWDRHIQANFSSGASYQWRLYRPLINENGANEYEFFIPHKSTNDKDTLQLSLTRGDTFSGKIIAYQLTAYLH